MSYSLINILGGYDSWGYTLSIFGCLLLGNILMMINSRIIVSVIGLGFWVIGGVALTGYMRHKLINLDYGDIGVIMVMSIFILTTIKMIQIKSGDKNKKKEVK